MNRSIAQLPRFLQALLPSSNWIAKVNRETMRPDLEAGLVGAILILPQAFALATLAGMPPEYGIYTSIIPVIIAALWGSSWHALSGPNTAVCVLIGFSVAPFATVGSEYYIGFVLSLTLMVGLIQLFIGIFRFGAVLDYISQTVIHAIVLAVALVIMVSASSAFLGVLSNIGEPFFIRLYQVAYDIPRSNMYAVWVGGITVATGFVARRFWRRYALVIAVVSGTVFSFVLNLLFGVAVTKLELVGNLDISLLPLSLPTVDIGSMYVLKELVASAFSIAFLGLMQSIVIARSLAIKSGQQIDTNQEIVGQGLSNVIAPFFSCFASSGSFNRSAAHFDAGARTPMAAVYASVLLAVIALAASSVIAYIPAAAVAGALILVGYGLIDIDSIRSALQVKTEKIVFLLTFVSALAVGLNAGVFVGLFLSLIFYLWTASSPNVTVADHYSRDGKKVFVVTIDGNLFFGSVRHVENQLNKIPLSEPGQQIILLRTDHLTYLDAPGAILLATFANRKREQGYELFLYVIREETYEILEQAGSIDVLGPDYIIHKDRDHPLKDVLYPSQTTSKQEYCFPVDWSNLSLEEGAAMNSLAQKIRISKVFGPLTADEIGSLLQRAELVTARAGEIIIKEDQSNNDFLLLLEGELEAQRTWPVPGKNDQSYTWYITPTEKKGGFDHLNVTPRVRARAVSDIKYILIDADQLDEMLGWSEQFNELLEHEPELQEKVKLFRNANVFHQLPLENIKQALLRLNEREVGAGETIICQGDKGDRYYMIKSGEAEVLQTDPFTDETSKVNKLGPGESFGEEALVQEGFRSASVVMTTPGKLYSLEKHDFDELIKPGLVYEIEPDIALAKISEGSAVLLDCRYDIEYEESRIPGANFIPLDQIRHNIHSLDESNRYIVYCRSGRRSKAAAFLLRERNIDAVSLAGGIKAWPYEIDLSPATDTDATAIRVN